MFLIELHWIEKWVLFEPKNSAEESIEVCIDRAKGLLCPMTGCLFVFLHNKICQFNLPHCPLPKAWSPQTCLSLHFEDDRYPFLHQVYWRFKTKYNNYQNLLNYNWEQGMQNRLTDPQCDANFSGNDLRGMQDCQKQNVSTIAAN